METGAPPGSRGDGMIRTPKVSEGLVDIASLDGRRGRLSSSSRDGHEALQADQREVYRRAQTPGSIAYLEAPSPQEADIAGVIMVSGGDRLLRVALGRNRTVNLIKELLTWLV